MAQSGGKERNNLPVQGLGGLSWVVLSALSAAPIRTTPYHRRPGYQPQNCGAPIHESVEESLRDAYGVAENWVDKSQRYCCTVSGSDNRVKVWEATELVKVEEVDEDLIFLCRMSLNVEWPKGA